MPWRDTRGHTNSRMDESVCLFADTYEQLTYDMSFPGKLCGIGDMLPLAATVSEQRIGRLNTFWSRAQDIDQVSASVPPTFLDNFYSNALARNPSWDKQDTTLIAAHGIASIGQVCKFNINAHVHLGGHLTT